MASRFLVIFLVLLSFSPLIFSVTGDFATQLDPRRLSLKKEKLTHLKFYWHDYGSGSGENITSVTVVNSTESSFPLFGQISVFDNPMTTGPELSSKQVGKSQGFYVFASQTEMALLQAMNLLFTEGKYNGSTLTVLGRNAFLNDTVREMPVIGGSGVFRFARGYALATTYEESTTYSNIEYNVYVLHY